MKTSAKHYAEQEQQYKKHSERTIKFSFKASHKSHKVLHKVIIINNKYSWPGQPLYWKSYTTERNPEQNYWPGSILSRIIVWPIKTGINDKSYRPDSVDYRQWYCGSVICPHCLLFSKSGFSSCSETASHSFHTYGLTETNGLHLLYYL
jgi:hypothetical protein